jgi:hypothetical protein
MTHSGQYWKFHHPLAVFKKWRIIELDVGPP